MLYNGPVMKKSNQTQPAATEVPLLVGTSSNDRGVRMENQATKPSDPCKSHPSQNSIESGQVNLSRNLFVGIITVKAAGCITVQLGPQDWNHISRTGRYIKSIKKVGA
jgi:hypothetical protein